MKVDNQGQEKEGRGGGCETTDITDITDITSQRSEGATMHPRVLQIIPADGWVAVHENIETHWLTKSPLAAWALMESGEDEHPVVVGVMSRGSDGLVLVDERADSFLRYEVEAPQNLIVHVEMPGLADHTRRVSEQLQRDLLNEQRRMG